MASYGYFHGFLCLVLRLVRMALWIPMYVPWLPVASYMASPVATDVEFYGFTWLVPRICFFACGIIIITNASQREPKTAVVVQSMCWNLC